MMHALQSLMLLMVEEEGPFCFFCVRLSCDFHMNRSAVSCLIDVSSKVTLEIFFYILQFCCIDCLVNIFCFSPRLFFCVQNKYQLVNQAWSSIFCLSLLIRILLWLSWYSFRLNLIFLFQTFSIVGNGLICDVLNCRFVFFSNYYVRFALSPIDFYDKY